MCITTAAHVRVVFRALFSGFRATLTNFNQLPAALGKSETASLTPQLPPSST